MCFHRETRSPENPAKIRPKSGQNPAQNPARNPARNPAQNPGEIRRPRRQNPGFFCSVPDFHIRGTLFLIFFSPEPFGRGRLSVARPPSPPARRSGRDGRRRRSPPSSSPHSPNGVDDVAPPVRIRASLEVDSARAPRSRGGASIGPARGWRSFFRNVALTRVVFPPSRPGAISLRFSLACEGLQRTLAQR